MLYLNRGLLLCIFMMLTACSLRPKQAPAPNLASISQVQQWQFTGKALFKSQGKKNTGNLIWRSAPPEFSIQVNSFIGSQVFALRQQRNFATLDIDGEQYQASSANELTAQFLGWEFPFAQSHQWLMGAAQPLATDFYQQGDWQGLVAKASYQSSTGQLWRLNFQRYQQQQGLWLPKLLVIEGPQSSVKIDINEWHVE